MTPECQPLSDDDIFKAMIGGAFKDMPHDHIFRRHVSTNRAWVGKVNGEALILVLYPCFLGSKPRLELWSDSPTRCRMMRAYSRVPW